MGFLPLGVKERIPIDSKSYLESSRPPKGYRIASLSCIEGRDPISVQREFV